jgi:hypothetical protein
LGEQPPQQDGHHHKPLNIPGFQIEEMLEEAHICAIALNADTATGLAYNVCHDVS